MKNTLRAVAPALALAIFAGACDNAGLTDINKDPNNPEFVSAPSILPQAEQSVVRRALGSNFNLTMLGLWAQSWAKIQYIDEDKYSLRTTTLDTHWTSFYSSGLEDFQKIIQQGQDTKNPNWVAIGTVMQQWTFQVLTDTWGDIPYGEALQDASNARPKYDAQKDVYYGMMDHLTAASAQIDPNGVSFGSEDGIYGGDMAAWRRFSNSLHLRMAMRISNVDPAKGKTEFLKALAAPGGVFTTNADNAQLHYSGAVPSDNPIYSVFHEGQRNDQAVSRTVTDTLRRLNDPRLAVYADARTTIDTACGGADFCGYQNGTVTAQNFSAVSPIGRLFKETPTYPSVMMSYSEVLFLQAEAAQRGWTAGDPADLYRRAILASMEQYGISGGAAAAYVAQPSVAYTGLRSIFLQKWIALYGNGPEQFAELRRSAFVNGAGDVEYVPYVTPAPQSSKQRVPFRVKYPAGEQSTNADNVLAAISTNGGGTLYDKRVWWNTKSWTGQDITTKL
jgi:hypothetical protein